MKKGPGPLTTALALPSTEAVADARQGLTIRRVLVALDEQPRSIDALEVALQIAGACRSEVALVHVIDPHLMMNPDGGIRPDILRADLERSGRSLLDVAAGRVMAYRTSRDEAAGSGSPSEPLRAWQFLEYGRPDHEVLRVSAEWQADLIVLGTRARSMLERLLLGSTAEGVLSRAHRPVLLVPSPT